MEVTSVAGGGLVTITLNSEGEMKAIKIKSACIDVEGLEFLVKAAYADVQKQLKEKIPLRAC